MQHTQPIHPIKFDPAATGPLDGIRVLDLTRMVAGNMLSLQLADFGADVIKVEPLSGDPLRDWRDGGHALHWKTYARNKRSMVLNFRHAGAKAVLLRLAATADVFMESFRPGTLEKMEIAPEALLKAGLADRNGFPDREPVLPPLALADMIAGLYGAFAVVTALRARDHGSRGQIIDLSLLEAMFSVLGPEAAIYRQTGAIKERTGSGSQTSAPRNVYRCQDGRYVALSGSTEAMARRIFGVIGRSDMIADARFSSNAARVQHRGLVDEAVGGWFAARTREEALQAMREAGVTVGPVYTIADAIADRHFGERRVLVDVEDAELGAVPMHNIVPRLSQSAGVWRRPAPRLGEHTDAVLTEAGFDGEAVARLKQEGVL